MVMIKRFIFTHYKENKKSDSGRSESNQPNFPKIFFCIMASHFPTLVIAESPCCHAVFFPHRSLITQILKPGTSCLLIKVLVKEQKSVRTLDRKLLAKEYQMRFINCFIIK